MQAPTLFVLAADLTRMRVNANIDESGVGQVEAGQQACAGSKLATPSKVSVPAVLGGGQGRSHTARGVRGSLSVSELRC